MNAKFVSRLSLRFAAALALAIALGACSDTQTGEGSTTNAPAAAEATDGSDASTTEASSETRAPESDQLFPDVVAVEATSEGGDSWQFSVTLSSPYDSPERYADSWRVVGPDGTVYGERFLTHDHAGEQPFTRSQSGIVIPPAVETVTVEGRDQISGWGGITMEYNLPK